MTQVVVTNYIIFLGWVGLYFTVLDNLIDVNVIYDVDY